MNTETETTKIRAINSVLDAVTMETLPTNQKQLEKAANKYGISVAELLNSYVGQEGRRKLKEGNHTSESAMQEFGLHEKVANSLRCLRQKSEPKPRGRKPKVKVDSVIDKTSTGTVEDESTIEEPLENVMLQEDETLVIA